MIIWLIASEYFWKKPAPVQPQKQEALSQKAVNTPAQAQNEQAIIATPADSLSFKDIPLNENIILENKRLKLTFSNMGGNLVSIVTKNYTLSDKKSYVELMPEKSQLMDMNLKTEKGNIILSARRLKHEITKTDSSQILAFYIEDSTGKRVFSKVFTMKDDYTLDFKVINDNFTTLNGYDLNFASGIKLTEDNPASVKDKINTFKVISQVNNEFQQVTLQKIIKVKKDNLKNDGKVENKSIENTGRIDWAAIRSKYFIYAIVPEKRIETKGIAIFDKNESPAFNLSIKYATQQNLFEDNYKLYLGPVDYHRLTLFKNGMEEIAELGGKWIRFISKFFLILLTFMNKFISNWGIVIIIFALLLKLALTPLTNKSMNSAKKMQEINPLMKEIQAKYKSDPVRMNQELKLLYKTHKVSPLGGCLPLLLQMPIFFALYPVLRYAIDLRQANFFGWLNDLSEPDKFWVLPILMGISMFFQQKMTMASTSKEALEKMDDQQKAMMQSQKMMMYLMPVMMFFIFKGLPSGLVLYWMVFNVFQIIQQIMQNNKNKKAII